MANLDTQAKRASSTAVLLPFLMTTPGPDGELSANDRAHISAQYGGLMDGGAAGGGGGTSTLQKIFRHHF